MKLLPGLVAPNFDAFDLFLLLLAPDHELWISLLATTGMMTIHFNSFFNKFTFFYLLFNGLLTHKSIIMFNFFRAQMHKNLVSSSSMMSLVNSKS
jgi:hypothetical protein